MKFNKVFETKSDRRFVLVYGNVENWMKSLILQEKATTPQWSPLNLKIISFFFLIWKDMKRKFILMMLKISRNLCLESEKKKGLKGLLTFFWDKISFQLCQKSNNFLSNLTADLVWNSKEIWFWKLEALKTRILLTVLTAWDCHLKELFCCLSLSPF